MVRKLVIFHKMSHSAMFWLFGGWLVDVFSVAYAVVLVVLVPLVL